MTEASLLPRIFLSLSAYFHNIPQQSAQAHLSSRSSAQGLAIYCYVGQPSFARSLLFSPSRNNTYYIYVYDYVHDQGNRSKPVGAGLRHKGFSPSSHIYYINNKIYVYINSTVFRSSSRLGFLYLPLVVIYSTIYVYIYLYIYLYIYVLNIP